MSRCWVVPLGGQLDLLAGWLEPILDRPGLEPVPADHLHVVVAEAGEQDEDERELDFEPFDALVGPARVDAEGVVGDVIPLEPFLALRTLVGASGPYAPRVVFARADGSRSYEPIEAVATEAVYVRTLTVAEVP